MSDSLFYYLNRFYMHLSVHSLSSRENKVGATTKVKQSRGAGMDFNSSFKVRTLSSLAEG